MEEILNITKRRGLIRVEHGKHGSRAMIWIAAELERFMGFTGEKVPPIETVVRPYHCIICNKQCALPNLTLCDEKKEMGVEWLADNCYTATL